MTSLVASAWEQGGPTLKTSPSSAFFFLFFLNRLLSGMILRLASAALVSDVVNVVPFNDDDDNAPSQFRFA